MDDVIFQLSGILKPLFWLAAAVLIVWLYYRHQNKKEQQRTDLMMRALEKTDNVDEVLRSMQTPQKSLRERLAKRAGWGWGLAIAGALMVVLPFIYGILITTDAAYDWDDVFTEAGPFSIFGAVLLGIGIGFLISYAIGKRMLKDEQ